MHKTETFKVVGYAVTSQRKHCIEKKLLLLRISILFIKIHESGSCLCMSRDHGDLKVNQVKKAGMEEN